MGEKNWNSFLFFTRNKSTTCHNSSRFGKKASKNSLSQTKMIFAQAKETFFGGEHHQISYVFTRRVHALQKLLKRYMHKNLAPIKTF